MIASNNMIDSFLDHLTTLFHTAIFPGDPPITLWVIIKLILFLCFVIVLTRILRNFLKNKLLLTLKLDIGNREAISTILSYSLGTLFFIGFVQSIGFKIQSLLFLIGSLGFGIGFALQDVIRNFISGLTVLIEQKIKVEDFIEFDGIKGYVKEISLRATVLRTRSGGDVIVPNNQLVESKVINWNYSDAIARIDLPIMVERGSDPVLVTEALLNAAYLENNILHEPAPQVLFTSFGEQGLQFELRVWINGFDRESGIKSSLHYLIDYLFRQNDIEIPAPPNIFSLQDLAELTTMVHNTSVTATLESTLAAKANSKSRAVRDLLKEVIYFANLTDIELRQLIEVGYRKRLYPEQVLFKEGDRGDAFYIVLSGSVDVVAQKINKHLATLKEGSFFGELSLMLGIPRTATVIAKEETLLFTISDKRFKKLLKENPQLAEVIVQELARHQQELSERRQQLKDMGLETDSEEDKNLVNWVRRRLTVLFNL
ncbi:mechanosensitive ion channel domain-containing protein [Spirulina sp. CCNP1310]|uniref:mechanosensitive ion channel domain-containing protein n=1 Tax=Spirulina sp. CCNP1310 TaxID=3110249 RepID=UPI002B216465|nr:mechanosensitive ion channel domain-containing protein [Spirulina sp. CCNP1310]MEA5419168.1 mechanosensitive ion channel domain-containing protein [Spirulina sp. CCNP1310]